MSDVHSSCPKCNGAMVQGFIADFAHAQIAVCTWVEGPPQKSFWMGTKVPSDNCIPVGTYRCSSCGFLESFARPAFDRQ